MNEKCWKNSGREFNARTRMEGTLSTAGDPSESPLAVQRSENSSGSVTAQSSNTPAGGDVASNGAPAEKPTITPESHNTTAATRDPTTSDEETLEAEEFGVAGSGSRSELPVLEPLSPTMSRAGNLNEQYEFLRRTLSHSRHRYSTRRSRPPPPRGSRGDGDRAAGREARTVSHLKERANPKHNSSAQSHLKTSTIAGDRSPNGSPDADLRGRREMLDRRYQSLNRSFHSSRGHRRKDDTSAPVLDPFNMSLTVHLDDSGSESVQGHTPATATKSKPSRFALFQKSNRTIQQTSRNSGSDDVMQLTPVPVQSGLGTGASMSTGDAHSSADASHELTSSNSPQTTHHTLRTGSPDLGRMMPDLRPSPTASNGHSPDEEEGLGTGGGGREGTYSPRCPSMLREASIENSFEVGADNGALSKELVEVQPGDQSKPALTDLPALQFILRKDLYSFLSSAGEAGEVFFANRALMELIQRIRADSTMFEKYQHSRHLVNALNKLAATDADLPDGWEKKLNQQGKVFFIDHTHQVTTFIDPRLPRPNIALKYSATNPTSAPNVRRQYVVQAEELIRSHHTTVVTNPSSVATSAMLSPVESREISYEDQVVAFFRLPTVYDMIPQKYRRGVRPQLREVVEDVRLNGKPALERVQLSGSVIAYELGLILSLFEEEISKLRPDPVNQPSSQVSSAEADTKSAVSPLAKKKEAFSSKLQTFKLSLARLGYAQGSRLKFNIRRDHLLEDAYEHVMKADVQHLQRKRLNIAFKGEEGLDYGGPSREFFFLLSRLIFNPFYGLFEYSANDTYTVQISATSTFISNSLDWLRFAGRVVALTIVQGFLLDVFFTRTMYKAFLGLPPSLKDLESVEPAFYNSLLWIQENDPEPLDLTFTVEEETFGQLTTHELKPGGLDVPVTEQNKIEYVDLMVRWRMESGLTEQMSSFLKGFSELLPMALLAGFDAQELEFLTAGTLEIDVNDWRDNTEYRNGYHPGHPVIEWFWRAVESFNNEERLRLLQFVTGTSSVPYEGFKALRGSNGPKKFTIDFFNDIKSLPRSHTCFNRIDLPPYSTYETLLEKLKTAINEGGTFAIE
ncbi:hypothetical protein EMCRGX_G012501 [Ephydatia muelleri]